MGKHLNPHRRLLQRQASILADERLKQSAVNGAEMEKLQQGHVRSGLRSNPTSMVHREPNWTSMDKSPKLGKIVKGQFKPKVSKPFSA